MTSDLLPLGNKDRDEVGTAMGQFVMATAAPFLGSAINDDPDDSWVSMSLADILCRVTYIASNSHTGSLLYSKYTSFH